MTILLSLFQFICLLGIPLLYLGLGAALIKVLQSIPALRGDALWGATHKLLLGLLFHTVVAFFLKLLHLPWTIALLAPFLPVLIAPIDLLHEIRAIRIRPHLNFLLWFAFNLGVGASIWQANEGIQTAWKNNYGDLAYHLGMISSFVRGDTIPPENHLLAGTRLSYPFMINFWSGLLWSFSDSLQSLVLIFLWQWVILTSLVYYFLEGDRYWLLPWALLLGGGSYFFLGENSGTKIAQNVPWTVFLTTVWIPQRAALFGVTALLGALQIFQRSLARQERGGRRSGLVFVGLVIGLMALVHAHLMLLGLCFVLFVIGGGLLHRFLIERFEKVRSKRSAGVAAVRGDNFSPEMLGYFVLPLLVIVLFLPWLTGKSNITFLIAGWATGDNLPGFRALAIHDLREAISVQGIFGWAGDWWPQAQARLKASAMMWTHAGWVWFILWAALWGITRRNLEMGVLFLLFLLGNLVQLAFWEWDQIKIFIGIYALLLGIWASSADRAAWVAHLLTIALCIPAIVELRGLLAKGELFTVYTKEVVAQALTIEGATPKGSVIAAAPDHNSPITLTGRPLFMGYEGTLFSHGLKYDLQKRMISALDDLPSCASKDPDQRKICPSFLFWDEAAKRFWRRQQPPAEGFEATAVPGLYSIKPR